MLDNAFMLFQINAEFKRITTMPLQSRFLSQLDFLSESLLRVFAKPSGKQGKMLKDMTDMMMVRTYQTCLTIKFKLQSVRLV